MLGRGSLFPLERSYVTSLCFLIFFKFRNDLLRTLEEKVELGWARGSLHEFLRQLYPVLPRGFSAVAAILAVVETVDDKVFLTLIKSGICVLQLLQSAAVRWERTAAS